MEKISSDGRVEMMCSVVAVFIMAFVVFYMFYSNNFFMRRRMKELGIYALLGYRKGSMLCLLTIENIFVCLGGTIVGILAGSLLHISVTAGIVALLGLTIDMGAIPFINPQAVSSIFLFILAVLLTLTLSNAVLLLKSTLLDLVRLEKKVEKPVRPNIVLSAIGIVSLLGGYALALDMVRGAQSVWTTILPYRIANTGTGSSWHSIIRLLLRPLCVPMHQKSPRRSVPGKHGYRGSQIYAPHPLQCKVADTFDFAGCWNAFRFWGNYTFGLVSLQSCGTNYSICNRISG